jgi:hypothetical protein
MRRDANLGLCTGDNNEVLAARFVMRILHQLFPAPCSYGKSALSLDISYCTGQSLVI